MEFQKEAEEYTPWKNLREQEEKQKAPDAKPAGYAAALLAKLNIKEAPVQAPKGIVILLGKYSCLYKNLSRPYKAKAGGS